jgi:hypothetical protein
MTKLEKKYFIICTEVDDLFVSWQIPRVFKIESIDHSMCSVVYDDQGHKRMNVFYKGAFYDRRAHATWIEIGKDS